MPTVNCRLVAAVIIALGFIALVDAQIESKLTTTIVQYAQLLNTTKESSKNPSLTCSAAIWNMCDFPSANSLQQLPKFGTQQIEVSGLGYKTVGTATLQPTPKCYAAGYQPKWTEHVMSSGNPGLAWQYVASTADGTFVQYPAIDWWSVSTCPGDFNPLFRPWFFVALTGAKTVVVAIDISGQGVNAQKRLKAQLEAAATILDMLSQWDYFNILTYDETSEMLFSTPQRGTNGNKVTARSFLADIRLSNSVLTDVGAAVRGAQLTAGEGCNTFVVLLTGPEDTVPSDAGQLAAKLPRGDSPDIHSFFFIVCTFNFDRLSTLPFVFRHVACTGGTQIIVDDPATSTKMIVDGFQRYVATIFRNDRPYWSEVYTDFMGQGRMTTGAIPIYDFARNAGMLEVKTALVVLGEDVRISTFQTAIPFTFLTEADVSAALKAQQYCPRKVSDADHVKYATNSMDCQIEDVAAWIDQFEVEHEPSTTGLPMEAAIPGVMAGMTIALLVSWMLYVCIAKEMTWKIVASVVGLCYVGFLAVSGEMLQPATLYYGYKTTDMIVLRSVVDTAVTCDTTCDICADAPIGTPRCIDMQRILQAGTCHNDYYCCRSDSGGGCTESVQRRRCSMQCSRKTSAVVTFRYQTHNGGVFVTPYRQQCPDGEGVDVGGVNSNTACALEFVNRHPVGSAHTVWYNPSKPRELSVNRPSMPTGLTAAWFILCIICCVCFLATPVVIWMANK